MQALARAMLRPAMLAGRMGMETKTVAACVSAASLTLKPACGSVRHWSAAPSEEALRKAERMVDVMSQSPALQQMMLGAMPAPLRNPEMVKQVFQDPSMRRKIAEMIATRGINIPDHMLERLSPTSMDETFARAKRLGLDPAVLFQRLMAHPGLLAKLQQPRFMVAFLDIAEDPTRQAKYEGDKEVLDVVFQVREIMGTVKAPASATPATPEALPAEATAAPAAPASPSVETPIAMGTGEAPPSSAPAPPPPGQPAAPEAAPAAAAASNEGAESSTAPPAAASSASSSSSEASDFNPLVALMRTDPKAAKWLENPTVMTALNEVQKSPWKTMKYVFNRDVMAAFKDLKTLMAGKKLE
ncbi:hypothetical protein Agub_g7993 [Astrephomene gubernaculifera]|uniref:STI1 domain-containing protein n=1 Tax=Astrephomene gubernaculifera TaxID=47775 RepID=A0AAD3DV46_9CHLO|nr:hypothetical protein Agub_g7993 [Astrephomene gubernaculifera]